MIDAAIGIVKANALRARNVDWSATEVAVRAMVMDSKTSADTYPAIRMLLSRLEDHHSIFLEPTRARTIATQGYASEDPVIKSLPGGIGYISMPAYMGTEETAVRKFAKSVRSSIYEVAKSARCGWIVDLRNDAGGNMWPMVQSLQPLLGAGPLGRFDETTGQSPPWNALTSDDTSAERPKDNLSVSKVGGLIGPKTASSGEAVAIAFIGRANTRSFGKPTAGLTTSNKPFDLPDGSRIFLTTGVDVDRNGRAYSGAIVPDEPIADSASSGSDPDVAAAKTWLASSKACRQSAVKNR
jgi:carboxyl-terminal processing protease